MCAFGAAGLAPSGAGRKIPGPVDGAVATITDFSLAVSFQVPGLGTYEAPADPMVVGGARACGGFLVGVTHALNPLQYEDGEFRAAMTAGKVLIGWAGAHGAVPAAPRTSRVLDATLVLHWNNHHISVGKLLGQAPKVLSSKMARAWAGRFIGTERGPLIEWMSSSSDRPQDGWFTVNALSMEQYVLRRYSDGWKLVQAYEQVIGKGVRPDYDDAELDELLATATDGMLAKLEAGFDRQAGLADIYARLERATRPQPAPPAPVTRRREPGPLAGNQRLQEVCDRIDTLDACLDALIRAAQSAPLAGGAFVEAAPRY